MNIDQRRQFLRRANEIRRLRADLKRDLAAGEVSIEDILMDPPDYIATAQVLDILIATPKLGRTLALRALRRCQINDLKTFEHFTERQASALIAYLRERHPGVLVA